MLEFDETTVEVLKLSLEDLEDFVLPNLKQESIRRLFLGKMKLILGYVEETLPDVPDAGVSDDWNGPGPWKKVLLPALVEMWANSPGIWAEKLSAESVRNMHPDFRKGWKSVKGCGHSLSSAAREGRAFRLPDGRAFRITIVPEPGPFRLYQLEHLGGSSPRPAVESLPKP